MIKQCVLSQQETEIIKNKLSLVIKALESENKSSDLIRSLETILKILE